MLVEIWWLMVIVRYIASTQIITTSETLLHRSWPYVHSARSHGFILVLLINRGLKRRFIIGKGTNRLCFYTLSAMSLLPMVERTYHYNDVIMSEMASQITSLTIVYSTVYSDADQRKHQTSASLAFVWGIHRWPVNSPHKWPVTRKMFPFDDVIM